MQWVANVAGTVRLSVEGPKPTWTKNAVEYVLYIRALLSVARAGGVLVGRLGRAMGTC